MSTENDTHKPNTDGPTGQEIPGGPAAEPNTREGREAAIEEGEEA